MRCINCYELVGKKHKPTCPEARRKPKRYLGMQKINTARLIGKFQHVIVIKTPCEKSLEVKGLHGEPPTLYEFLSVVKNHRDSCTICNEVDNG